MYKHLKISLLFVFLISKLSFSQKIDSVRYIDLQKEINSFHNDLPLYAKWLTNNTSQDSIKIQSAEIGKRTHDILNHTLSVFGIRHSLHDEYATDLAMATAMKQVSPILAESYYAPQAIIKLGDNSNKLPKYYKEISVLFKKTDEITKKRRKKKILKMPNELAILCQKLQENLYFNKL